LNVNKSNNYEYKLDGVDDERSICAQSFIELPYEYPPLRYDRTASRKVSDNVQMKTQAVGVVLLIFIGKFVLLLFL